MVERILEKQILAKINTNKAIILLGPRQVGKTTLLKSLIENSTETI
jgi:predicted AAA+ superfamily ATPase